MKPTSFLNTISQPHPHRTSIHSHLQSTAYHYNKILHAKPQVDNTSPNQKTCLNNLKNKHNKNINAQRMYQNRKLLKSLVHIQHNYTLYGVKDLQNNDNKIYSKGNNNNKKINSKGNSTSFYKSKRGSLDSRISQLCRVKTLKNPFIQKMQKLKISQQNVRFYEKITNASPQIQSKRELKQWSNKLRYFGNLMQSNRSKQQCNVIKDKFFNTYNKMRSLNQIQSSTIRLSVNSLILNPQLYTIDLHSINKKSKQQSDRDELVIRQQKVKRSKKRKHKLSNKLQKRLNTTIDNSNYNNNICDNNQINNNGISIYSEQMMNNIKKKRYTQGQLDLQLIELQN